MQQSASEKERGRSGQFTKRKYFLKIFFKKKFGKI